MKGAQRYEIYINTTKLILIPTETLKTEAFQRDETHLVARYNGGVKHLMNYIDMFEKTSRVEQQVIHHHDFDNLLKTFLNLFKIVPAAGGLVVNEESEILFIHRNDHWDLPKGKYEDGETIEETAVREVEEETGAQNVELGEKLKETHHVYKNRSGKRCIKLTHWYLMKAPKQDLVPQEEENIQSALWKNIDEVVDEPNVYGNIRDLLNLYKSTL